jgi:hypothetical protein
VKPVGIILIHYPVLNRSGQVITSAVTNLDIHDLARLSATYGLSRFYVVTPSNEQQRLTSRIAAHWLEGYGASYNIHRKYALASLKVCSSLEEVLSDWNSLNEKDTRLILTGAKHDQGLSFQEAQKVLTEYPTLLAFGTGHGLAEELYQQDRLQLNAVRSSGYNHLSVRTAAAIIVDRLLGDKIVPEHICY